MKVCPKCNQQYADQDLNFCLSDGEFLTELKDDAPPTIFMDPTRTTNPNHWQQPLHEPLTAWQNPQTNLQNQPVFAPPAPFFQPKDQVLPVISLILGILGSLLVCCWGGLWLGIPAVIVGYLGMKNADHDPQRYGGRGMAIAGMILGGIGVLMFFVFILIGILGK